MKKAAVLFISILILGSCAGQGSRVRNVRIYEYQGTGEELILENEFLEFRFLPKTAEIILRDKKSGALWRSNPEGVEDAGADPVTKQLMLSQFSLEYADQAGVGMTLYSSRHSVERGAYEYTVTDGGLDLRYTVGDLARTYVFPPAATEKRMLPFLEKMDRSDRRKVESGYRLYDINNLRPTDDKNSLLALYPDLAREKVYVLRDSAQEYMKVEIEKYFADAGYTYDDYIEDAARFASAEGPEKPAFNISIRYELEGNSLLVSVPFDQIAYRPSYPIMAFSLLPFMGAGGLEDKGYLLVPDGGGALIYFNNGKQNQTAYNNRVYGWDEGMPRDAVISDNKAPYPLFGIQKNGAALACIIEEGSAYASIRADVSGRNCSYNSVHARFDMIHGATMDIAGRTEQLVYLYEPSLPAGERIALRFTPCQEDGYVGMAKEYRAWLLRAYPDHWKPQDGGIPIAVEIIGAVNKTQHRIGLPFDLPLKLTTYKEAEGMIRDFADLGWKNPQVKLKGWFNRSVDHTVPSKIKLIGELGSRADFMNLVNAAKEREAILVPELDFLYLKDPGLFDGFSLYRDVGRYVNRKRMEAYPFSFVWFGERKWWGKMSYIARPMYMASLIDRFIPQAEKLGLENIAFRSLGSKLAGDYNEKRHVSREAAMKIRREKLAEIRRGGTGVLINTGFAYAAPYADFITDLALDDQGFGITDVSVPVYPIALHGLVPYAGTAINLAEDYTKALLKTVETGAGLYFSFMTEETSVLQETKFRQFYANEYGKWIGDADALYKRFSHDFGGLYSRSIENHEILAPGLTLTEYDNGVQVIVNSSDQPREYRGLRIGANDYAVFRQKE
ncbi:MAG: DUF5696 domain-containing protein [Treponema sp.]|nr:DUF5696 domain-containing protein [Treponema sp.]